MEKQFTPYVSHGENPSEITALSVISGILLAIVFGAANAYLGLKVGMTVSASIPAAVVAMGIMRAAGRKSVTESNIVQTVGSAGESLAAGAIFTLPALFMWAAEGYAVKTPSLIEITLITISGGLLGVFFMIPLRRALIVKEHGSLPYPEGTACAGVLISGGKSDGTAGLVFAGMGFAAAVKLITDGFRLVSGEVNLRFRSFAGVIGTQIYPAVLSVGFICGPRIASCMFSGGVLAWMALIPLVVLSGGDGAEAYATGGAEAVWSGFVRYIGAGALAAGGVISLIKSLPLIFKTFADSLGSLKVSGKNETLRTEKSLSLKTAVIAVTVLVLFIWLIPVIPISLGGALVVAVFGFFFATVSSRMVGLVGASNNPVSGMTIATLIITAYLLKLTGKSGAEGMSAAIAIGSVVCIVAAIAGDTSQDLKTGFLIGATPKKQQIGEVVGVVAASVTISATLYLLNNAWGFGSEELAAPQAGLMKLIVEGVMENSLPWTLVLAGVFIALSAELSGIPVLPFAIGVYLPVQLSACIMAGGLVRLFLEKYDEKTTGKGVLFCSGMIAGEGIAGVALALLTVTGLGNAINLSGIIPPLARDVGGAVLFAAILLILIRVSGCTGFSSERKKAHRSSD